MIGMKNQRGYTLVEILIVIAVVGMLALLVGGLCFRSCVSSEAAAKEGATKWAADLRIPDPTVSCADRDTDGDGYVSCSISSKGSDGKVQVIPVECAAQYSCNTGCRTPKAIVRTAQ